MHKNSLSVLLFATLSLTASSVWAQSVIAAKAGMIHYSEGRVMIDGERLTANDSAAENQEFKFVKEGETLSTTKGRAEVLLNPGTFLRIAENSSVRLVASDLEDTRLELTSGSALIEVSEVQKYTSVAIAVGESNVQLQKQGLYQFTVGETSRLRVYDGEAIITTADNDRPAEGLKVKKGREITLNVPATQLASTETVKFDREENDALYRWSARRDRVLAQVNQSSALMAANNGYGRGSSSWMYNPSFGMYTFLPGSGYGYSPFGIRYYSPVTVMYLYAPPMISPGPGFGGSGSSAGLAASPVYTNSGGMAATSVGTMSSAPAAAAPAASPNTGGARRR